MPNPSPPGTADGNPGASANPTPVSINVPSSAGLFRAVGDFGTTLYKQNPDGTAHTFNLLDASNGLYPQGMIGAGQQAGLALQNLKSQYGIDYNALPQVNIGDYISAKNHETTPEALARGPQGFNFTQSNNIQDFVGAPHATLGQQTMNGPGSGATPATAADIAAQKSNPNWVNPETNSGAGAPGQQTAPVLQSKLPGASATTLSDYFSARGQQLPTWQQNGQTFEQLGLGKASDFTGTAAQNTELLAALQRKDYSASTFGDANAQANAGANINAAANATPAGQDLTSGLGKLLGTDTASGTLSNYQTFLATAMGKTWDQLQADEGAVTSYINGMPTTDNILQDAMNQAGVTSGQSILASLDSEIQKQQSVLDSLPSAIKTSLQDVGVSQAQLTRLTAKESAAPTAALKTLMTQRNATSTEIDKAMTFAKDFASTQAATQAAKLAAMEWAVKTEQGDYASMSTEQKTLTTQALSDQKDMLATVKTAAGNGAPPEVQKAIMAAQSPQEAVLAAGQYMVTPAKANQLNNLGGGTATDQRDALMGQALTAAAAAIKSGADPNAVRQRFLGKFPTNGAAYNSYFNLSSGASLPSAITPPSTSGGAGNILSNATSWLWGKLTNQ